MVLLPNFARSLKVAEENRELTPQELKPFSGICSTFGVQNLNPQQEKAFAEFLSGSDVFVNLPTNLESLHSSVAIELSKRHSRMENLPEKKV